MEISEVIAGVIMLLCILGIGVLLYDNVSFEATTAPQPPQPVNNTTQPNVSIPTAQQYDAYNLQYWQGRLNS
jgi:hypothetical protein